MPISSTVLAAEGQFWVLQPIGAHQIQLLLKPGRQLQSHRLRLVGSQRGNPARVTTLHGQDGEEHNKEAPSTRSWTCLQNHVPALPFEMLRKDGRCHGRLATDCCFWAQSCGGIPSPVSVMCGKVLCTVQPNNIDTDLQESFSGKPLCQ